METVQQGAQILINQAYANGLAYGHQQLMETFILGGHIIVTGLLVIAVYRLYQGRK